MIIETQFTQRCVPVFCDVCNLLDKYLTIKELNELLDQGWLGDWMCEMHWDEQPDFWHPALQVTDEYLVGFCEEVEEEIFLPIPGTNNGNLRVAMHRIVEVSYDRE